MLDKRIKHQSHAVRRGGSASLKINKGTSHRAILKQVQDDVSLSRQLRSICGDKLFSLENV